ncbi:DUF2767 domain-containing protein, partial [Pseudomonas donghuensis]|nr:DUF2767 domain-containing protein [Pseudomonas donghuensis]
MATNEEVFMTIRNNRAEISLALGEAV